VNRHVVIAHLVSRQRCSAFPEAEPSQLWHLSTRTAVHALLAACSGLEQHAAV